MKYLVFILLLIVTPTRASELPYHMTDVAIAENFEYLLQQNKKLKRNLEELIFSSLKAWDAFFILKDASTGLYWSTSIANDGALVVDSTTTVTTVTEFYLSYKGITYYKITADAGTLDASISGAAYAKDKFFITPDGSSVYRLAMAETGAFQVILRRRL